MVRPAAPGDMGVIAEISRGTWEGADYLEEMAAGWMEDGTLHVGQLDGSVIGTFRLSLLPERVLWLEALRIHPDRRGEGFGRILAQRVFQIGSQRLRSGEADCMEFSTYVHNMESRHISESQGFRVTGGYMLLYKDDPESRIEVTPIEARWEDFNGFPEHICCGWKFVRTSREGFLWVMKRCRAFAAGDARFLATNRSSEIMPLAGALLDPASFLRGAETVASLEGESETIVFIHQSHEELIETACKEGYQMWEPVTGSNVMIYRFTPGEDEG